MAIRWKLARSAVTIPGKVRCVALSLCAPRLQEAERTSGSNINCNWQLKYRAAKYLSRGGTPVLLLR
jgi:hypothetical protein